MPFEDARFSSVACFTSAASRAFGRAQDRLFSEACRVLRPGAPFAGSDSTGRGIVFALLHVGDTKVLVDPGNLDRRLAAAGFEDVEVSSDRDTIRFRARRPEPRAPERLSFKVVKRR